MQNYTDNASGNAPFDSKKCVVFLIFFEIKVRTYSFGEKNKSYLINRLVYKKQWNLWTADTYGS